MKNECLKPVKLDSIAELHRKLGLPGSLHPLVSLLDVRDGQVDMSRLRGGYISGFYKISLITKLSGKFRYGQGYYDFDEG
jgi:AraC family transcriptional activator of pobA